MQFGSPFVNSHRSRLVLRRLSVMIFSCLGLFLSLLPSSGVVQAETKTRAELFDPMDVFQLEYVGAMAVSPDGKTIVYERVSNGLHCDCSRRILWRIGADGANHEPLLADAELEARSPLWSPSGDRIAYIARTQIRGLQRRQIFVLNVASGKTLRVTEVAERPGDLAWSPDGTLLAFTMATPREVKPIVKPRKAPQGARWAKSAKEVTSLRYQVDGSGIVAAANSHIFVVPSIGGTARRLSNDDFNHFGPLQWDAKNQSILFSADRHPEWERRTMQRDLYSVQLATGEITQLTSASGVERNPRLSPDGRYLAYLAAPDNRKAYAPYSLQLLDRQSGQTKALLPDRDLSFSNLLWDRSGLYAQYDERGKRKVAKISVRGKFQEKVGTLGSASLGRPYLSGSYHVANGTIAFQQGSPDRPAELGVFAPRAQKPRQLTKLNEDILAQKTLGTVTEIRYPSSHDGQEIQGWYIKPPQFDASKQYPVVVEIHGGPHLAYGPFFSAELQLLAAAGYVVFYDNYRGSTSYGTDFALLLQYKYSSPDDFADHVSGLDALIAKGFVDPANQFIAGGSAGGIGTAYAIGLTDRFNAAVAAKPVVNWISKTLTADSSVGQIHRQFPAPPWEAFEHYWQRSPLSLVGNMTTPTLLITGEHDRRTPISETEQLYQALRLKGVDSAMVRIPGASHNIAGRPSRLVAKVDYILAWFERYKKAPPIR